MKAQSELVEGALLLLVAFLLVNTPNCLPRNHLSFELASVVQGMQSTATKLCLGTKKVFPWRRDL